MLGRRRTARRREARADIGPRVLGRRRTARRREARADVGPRVAPAIDEQRSKRRLTGNEGSRGAYRRHAAARSKAPPCCAPRYAQRSATGSSAARLMFDGAGAQPRPLRRRVLRGSLGRSRREGARGTSRKRRVASLYEASPKAGPCPKRMPLFVKSSLSRRFSRAEGSARRAKRIASGSTRGGEGRLFGSSAPAPPK